MEAMEEAEPDKQQLRIMVTRSSSSSSSSTQRKPFSNLTNLIPQSHHHQSNKTRNRLKHAIDTCDDSVGDGNQIAYSRRPTTLKTKNKIKATAVTVYQTHHEKTKNKIDDLQIPLSEFKDNGKAVTMSSSVVDLSKKHEEKDKGSICPLLKIRSNRNEVDGTKDALQSKLPTDPLPNNKKRKYSSKGSSKEFVLPQDFIDQQRAHFKEIDEYELEVEEVSAERRRMI